MCEKKRGKEVKERLEQLVCAWHQWDWTKQITSLHFYVFCRKAQPWRESGRKEGAAHQAKQVTGLPRASGLL